MNIRDLQVEVHALAKSKGWHEGQDYQDPNTVAAKLALIHSEVSEALEAVREGDRFMYFREDGKPEGLPSELADVVIRVLDLSEALGIDLGKAIEIKHGYNQGRAYRHGGKTL